MIQGQDKFSTKCRLEGLTYLYGFKYWDVYVTGARIYFRPLYAYSIIFYIYYRFFDCKSEFLFSFVHFYDWMGLDKRTRFYANFTKKKEFFVRVNPFSERMQIFKA